MKKLLKPFASLYLTVPLLFMSMVLVYAGTSAQKEAGIWDVQHRYFHSFVCTIPFKYLLPLSEWWWDHARIVLPGGHVIDRFPFLGGYTLIALLLLNLLAAHTVRFKLTWKRTGIILIHFGLILLLVGEVLTSLMANEAIMSLNNGDSTSYAEDIRDVELAVTDPSSADHDTVVVVASSRLDVDPGTVIQDPRLPFDVRVEAYYPNSTVMGPEQMAQSASGVKPLANAGSNRVLGLMKLAPFSGVGDEGEQTNTPGAYLTFMSRGKPLGTYLLVANTIHAPWTVRQAVDLDGKTYYVQLRLKRVYKPYTVRLVKFTHDSYLGTDMAKNFASRVELIDKQAGVDREVVISMNHPLRYQSDTIYQSRTNRMLGSANEGTVLQDVNNPNWLMPYFAVVIGGLGLVIHFGMSLITFLNKRSAAQAKALPPLPRKGKGAVRDGDSYTLKPSWSRALVPMVSAALALLFVGAFFASALLTKNETQFDLDAFGKTAVYDKGRVLPLDSFARNYLKIINTRQSFEAPVDGQKDKTRTVTAVQWIADMLTRPEVADDYKVFRVDNDDVKGVLGLNEAQKYFSWNELFHDPSNPQKLEEQARKVGEVPDKKRDAYQAKILELFEHATTYMRLGRGADFLTLYDLNGHPEKAREFSAKAGAIEDLDPKQRTPDQNALLERYHRVRVALADLTGPRDLPSRTANEVEQKMDAEQRRKEMDLYLPVDPDPSLDFDKHWIGMGQAVLDLGQDKETPSAAAFFRVLKDFRDNQPAAFNADLAAYRGIVERFTPGEAAKASFEVFFNRFDPFLACIILYIGVFLLACAFWISGNRAMASAAMNVVVLTWIVHSIGLICRVYISGRPPVTNLYSSAVFIAWGAGALCIGLEKVYKNGVGSAVSAAIGVCGLLIADALAHRDADTMGQLQAVLDTNFWLATHVVCVTLGYAATFLAGVLAIVFVLGNLCTGGLHSDTRKELTRMTYGVICFAMLFSFVGTILGGIWADQSWGRFWGWDPKENGAVLIVLWNALILHARWGGLVKDKGIALLAIFGNIITSWSWFGTNMLGIGLHSYGFMGQAFVVLTIFVVSQLVLIFAGLFIRPASSRPVPVIPIPAR